MTDIFRRLLSAWIASAFVAASYVFGGAQAEADVPSPQAGTPRSFHARPPIAGETVTLRGMLTDSGTEGWLLAEDSRAYVVDTQRAGIVPSVVRLGLRLPRIDHAAVGEGALVIVQGTAIDTGCGTRRRCVEVPAEMNVVSLKMSGYGDRFAFEREAPYGLGKLIPIESGNPEWAGLEQLTQRIVNGVRLRDLTILSSLFDVDKTDRFFKGKAEIVNFVAGSMEPEGEGHWKFLDPQYSFSVKSEKTAHTFFVATMSESLQIADICLSRSPATPKWPTTDFELYHANVTDPYVCYRAEKTHGKWWLILENL
jgi:hypothetical protein